MRTTRHPEASHTPDTVLGHRTDGRPIYPVAGGANDEGNGDQTADATGAEGDNTAQQNNGEQPANTDETAPAGSYSDDYVRKLRDENAGHRNRRKDAESERDQYKSLVDTLKTALDPNAEENDPTKAAEKAAKERDEKDAELRALRIDQAVDKAARKHGADADALADSRAFAKQTSELDPTANGFTDELDALVSQTVEANPKLRATPAAARSSSEFTSGSGGESGKPAEGDIAGWRKYLKGND